MPPKSLLIYTIGHSTHPIEEFVAILHVYSIRQLVDIRSVPRSRHNPQFEQTELEHSLPAAGISYCHLKKLGGLRRTVKDSVNMGWRLGANRERETVREAVAAERRRIARELHDIVSHAVTEIVFQAAAAAQVADTDFAQVKQSLANIEAAGRQAMAELQRLVKTLDADQSAGHIPGASELTQQPGLADLTVLLTSLRAIGMPVTVHVEGTPCHLEPNVDLVAYRIVQEGLTNVLKHAGKDSNPRLRLVWENNGLLIQIDNDTNPEQAHHGQALSVGRGLVGLHERTLAVGGRLHAGFHHHGGYRLTATLPRAAPEVSSIPCPSSRYRGDQGKITG